MNSDVLIGVFAFGLVFYLEGIFPYFAGRKRRIAHALPNLTVAAFNALVTFLFVSTTITVAQWAGSKGIGILNNINFPVYVKLIAGIVLFDAWMYVWHLSNHKIAFLWRFHRMHHTETQMDSSTALRFHPGEIVISSLLNILVVAVIGLSYEGLIIYKAVLMPVIFFHHSNVALPEKYDFLLKKLIVSPDMHRVHHSQIMRETNSNYGSIFSFWDKLFRTFVVRKNIKEIVFGLKEFTEQRWQSIPGMLRMPVV